MTTTAALTQHIAALRERLHVQRTEQITDENPVALIGDATVPGAAIPEFFVTSVHPSREAAIATIRHDGVNPLPAMISITAKGVIRTITYDPVEGMGFGDMFPLADVAAGGLTCEDLRDDLGHYDD